MDFQSAQFHSAKDGFNDIKALPTFAIEEMSLWYFLLTGLVLLALAFWFLLKKRHLPQKIQARPTTPFENFQNTMRLLQDCQEAREYGAQLSHSTRLLLAETLRTETEFKTLNELRRDLAPTIREMLPLLSEEKRSGILEAFLFTLSQSNTFMFAHDAEQQFSQLNKKAFEDSLLKEVEELRVRIEQERARTQSVMEHSDAA